MRILLDTCILSELRNPHGNQQVKKIYEDLEDRALYISAITLGEIAYGVNLLHSGKKKDLLQEWVKIVEQEYYTRLFEVDGDTALIWADLAAQTKKKGHNISSNDLLIAATALQHNLHLMTIKTNYFKALGIQLLSI